MLNQKKFADMVFTFPASGHSLYAHRAVLALRSVYFRTMFNFNDHDTTTLSASSSSIGGAGHYRAIRRETSNAFITSGSSSGDIMTTTSSGVDSKGEIKRLPIASTTVVSSTSVIGSSTPDYSGASTSSSGMKRPRPISPLPTTTTSPTYHHGSSGRPLVQTAMSGKDRTSSTSTIVRGLDEDEPTTPRSTSFTTGSSSSGSDSYSSNSPSSMSMRDGRHEVIIDDIDYDVFYRMIAYIYGAVPITDPMSFPLLRQLLALASRYLLEELRMECGRILMWFVAEDSCIELLQDAVQNNVIYQLSSSLLGVLIIGWVGLV
jgi:hypothetical protein